MAIIRSILDTDLYKLTMQQVFLFYYPLLKVKYKLTIRDKRVFPEGFVEKLNAEINEMTKLRLTDIEEKKLRDKMGHIFTESYIQYLKNYVFDSSEVTVSMKNKCLEITIEGYLHRTTLWEVPLMALISELYFIETGQIIDIYSDEVNSRDIAKIKAFEENGVEFTDFGTRRRYSYENQKRFLSNHISSKCLKGTSNVHFALIFDINCVGTMAHEWMMVNAAVHGYTKANEIGLKYWKDFYKDDLSIALPDTLTTDVFLRTFDKEIADGWQGLRHDSSCPKAFTVKIVNHYNSIGIDPLSKVIVYSDNLKTDSAIEITKFAKPLIGMRPLGIGTFITNDVGVTPMNMVIKVSHVLIDGKWKGTVKLSDEKMKYTGSPNDIKECKEELGLE